MPFAEAAICRGGWAGYGFFGKLFGKRLAERVGFEPTEGLRPHLISSQARSTGLRHLSAEAETYPKIR